eukprot:scaffold18426_cov31-Tisochrysis_lutea.AAC.2
MRRSSSTGFSSPLAAHRISSLGTESSSSPAAIGAVAKTPHPVEPLYWSESEPTWPPARRMSKEREWCALVSAAQTLLRSVT